VFAEEIGDRFGSAEWDRWERTGNEDGGRNRPRIILWSPGGSRLIGVNPSAQSRRFYFCPCRPGASQSLFLANTRRPTTNRRRGRLPDCATSICGDSGVSGFLREDHTGDGIQIGSRADAMGARRVSSRLPETTGWKAVPPRRTMASPRAEPNFVISALFREAGSRNKSAPLTELTREARHFYKTLRR
jgi:hypothetical protein